MIEKLIPEIDLIKDKDLRDKVIKVWNYAVEKGGWSFDDLKSIPFTLLIENTGCSIIEHTRAVVNTSISIAEVFKRHYPDININMDYLIAGAILHDVGKLIEYRRREDGSFTKSTIGERIRHPVSGAYISFIHGIPEDVLHIIASHSKEGNFVKRSVEATIVYHADFVNFESLKGE